MPSVLEQIGFAPTEFPAAEGGGVTPEGAPAGAAPVAEASQPAKLKSAKDFADTIVAGVITLLDQAVAFYGASSDEGRAIISAIRKLETVVPREKLDAVKAEMSTMFTSAMGPAPGIGPAGPGGAPTAPPPAPMGVPGL